MLQLRYFASLKEQLGIAAEEVALEKNVRTLADLRDSLCKRGAPWDQALSNQHLKVALNQEIVTHDAVVNDGDEVAWLPPVTGG